MSRAVHTAVRPNLHFSPTKTPDVVAGILARYGLVVVIAWFGVLKFMDYEAKGIVPLVSESPLMNWLYGIFSVTTFSALLGAFELAAAALLAVKPWWPRVSILGSVLAIALFVATISFLFSTPGVTEATAGGFPALSVSGEFLIKDIALLGIAAWTLSDALRATRSPLTAGSQGGPR
jgi:reactive chlorine resistance protein C